jgi:uncharacterized membrane protein YjdF
MSVTLSPARQAFRKTEFIAFSALALAGKSMLLIRLPYREWYINTAYTFVILGFSYLYFRVRQRITLPPIIIFCLAMAVAIDVLGNFFHLYGHEFGPVQYDEFTHLFGSGLSLPPTMWLLRTTTRRMGIELPADFLAFLSITITFSLCSYYEILELWDEQYFGGKRIWTLQDTANDLQWDLAGIIIFALVSSLIFSVADRRKEQA